MGKRKYYCDYCDKQFQDTAADRKRHVRGIQHQQAKARWYDSFKQQNPIFPNSKQPLCIHFLNTGFCRYGESCKYLHPQIISTAPSPSPSPGQFLLSLSSTAGIENLPPSLQPPPEAGYPHLPFLDWGFN
ncbi:zinc finger CCCH domain-containing protein 3 [Abrus precatorius]|uniref:Zinc finger CCCH domain-containing protein 3 n=1 Tax=Abrus precatorius TaxID=3816 RepID=A0A8B8M7V1_ABRPR|nr:zinc finger CCCH domain-containing protein 3 [Abrus precatorius]